MIDEVPGALAISAVVSFAFIRWIRPISRNNIDNLYYVNRDYYIYLDGVDRDDTDTYCVMRDA